MQPAPERAKTPPAAQLPGRSKAVPQEAACRLLVTARWETGIAKHQAFDRVFRRFLRPVCLAGVFRLFNVGGWRGALRRHFPDMRPGRLRARVARHFAELVVLRRFDKQLLVDHSLQQAAVLRMPALFRVLWD